MTPKIRAIPLSTTVLLMACGVHVPIGPDNPTGEGGASGTAPGLDGGKTSAIAPLDDGGADTLPDATSSLFLLIDDMEDGTRAGFPPPPPGGAGFWWPLGPLGNWFFGSAGSDWSSTPHGDAVADSIVPPRGDSKKARHVQGDGLANGTDLLAQLDHPTGRSIDLHAYLGISFWARLSSPSGRLIVALGQDNGAPFLPAESSQFPYFAQSISVSDQWERFILLFSDFRQGVTTGSTSGVPLAANAIASIDFVVGLKGESFDLWIDDLSLLCPGVCQPAHW
jgi:hypothetical protein